MNSLLIRTPEGIEFALPLAGPFSRMCSLALDLAVVATFNSVIQKIPGPLQLFRQDPTTSLGFFFFLTLIYGIFSEWTWRGQTVGKRLLGLRVVDARGLRLEPSQVIVRNLLRFIDALPGLYLVGGVACLLSRYRQRLGDLAAGTVVIRTPAHTAPDLDILLGGKYNSLAESRHLAARLRQKVTPGIARVALETLLRRDRLDPAARLAIFVELATYLKSLVPYPADLLEQIADEQYVRNVIEILYRR